MSRSFLWLSVALAAAAFVGTESNVVAQALPSSSAATASAPKADYPGVAEAVKMLNNRDLNGALEKLKAESRLHPELPSQYVMMFRILAQNNQANAARAMIERAITDPDTANDPENWVILGSIALQDSRLAEAEIDFLKARQLLASYPNEKRKAAIEQFEMLGMASVAERRGRWTDAEDRLQEYLKANPDDIVALQRLAQAMFILKKYGKTDGKPEIGAYDILKHAKEVDKAAAAKNNAREQMLPAAYYMGQYYDQSQHQKEQQQGKPFVTCPEAKKWFIFALSQAPDDLELRKNVCVWALENGDTKLAEEQAQAALRIEKENPKLFSGSTLGRMLAGYVALWQKQYDKAEDFFGKVTLESPNDFAAKNNMALTLVEESKDENKQRHAAEWALGNYKANQDNADALSTLSWVAFRTGDFRTAEMAINQVIKNTNGNLNPDTTTYLAYILDHNGQKFQAKQALDALLKSGRNFSMKPEAEALAEKVKDAKAPETSGSKAP